VHSRASVARRRLRRLGAGGVYRVQAARGGAVSELVRLDPQSVDAIAQRLLELLRDQAAIAPATPELLTAAEVARRFNVDRSWVYENAERLGVVRLGGGPRPRLRFDPERVAEALRSCSTDRRAQDATEPAAEPRRRPARRRALGTGVELLPIRGTSERPGGRPAA
jgi:hypothetical protein